MSAEDITTIKVLLGRIEERLKVLERVVYGIASVVGVTVTVAILKVVVAAG